MPHNHKKNLCTFPTSTPELAGEAIEHALAAQSQWEALPFAERAAVFLKVSKPFFPFSPRSVVPATYSSPLTTRRLLI